MGAGFLEVSRYRELIWTLVRRDIKRRYKGSILGFLWYLVNPLLIMGIIWVVFGLLLKARFSGGMEGYAIYLLTGLITWNFFTQSVLNSSTNLVGAGGLMRKVYVPKAIFPLATVGGSLVNYLLSLIPLFLLILVTGRPVGWAILFLPVGLLPLLVFCTGLALLVSSLNIFYRDVHHIAEVFFLGWFYATPIIWPGKMIPELEALSRWNPMALIVECIRQPISLTSM